MMATGLAQIPEKLDEVLDSAPAIEGVAREFSKSNDAFFLGRGLD